jgi:hypothetical protein
MIAAELAQSIPVRAPKEAARDAVGEAVNDAPAAGGINCDASAARTAGQSVLPRMTLSMAVPLVSGKKSAQ